MKRNIALVAVLSLAVAGLAFGQVKAKDGVYFAKDAAFPSSGWAEEVVITVKGGKIVSADWNGVSNIAGAADKKSYDAAGKYGMMGEGFASPFTQPQGFLTMIPEKRTVRMVTIAKAEVTFMSRVGGFIGKGGSKPKPATGEKKGRTFATPRKSPIVPTKGAKVFQ